jgi:enoyl-[acyl-carrier protein] reductase II
MGTRFVASHEARAAQDYKKRIGEIREEDTVVTRCYSGKPMRVIRNAYVEDYESRPEEIQPFPTQLGVSIKAGVFSAVFPDTGEVDVSRSAMPCGQGAGAITDELSCAAIIERVVGEAEEIIERLAELRG